jgi:hypothetical protein
MLQLTAILVPAVTAVVVAWLMYSRKRLKIGGDGEVAAEALTLVGIRKLLKEAEEFKQRNQSKAIHEP